MIFVKDSYLELTYDALPSRIMEFATHKGKKCNSMLIEFSLLNVSLRVYIYLKNYIMYFFSSNGIDSVAGSKSRENDRFKQI